MATAEELRTVRDRNAAMTYRPVSERHNQILLCRCVHGMTNDETGEHLCISGDTVKNTVTRILRRLGVRTMAQACYRLGRILGPEKVDE